MFESCIFSKNQSLVANRPVSFKTSDWFIGSLLLYTWPFTGFKESLVKLSVRTFYPCVCPPVLMSLAVTQTDFLKSEETWNVQMADMWLLKWPDTLEIWLIDASMKRICNNGCMKSSKNSRKKISSLQLQ